MLSHLKSFAFLTTFLTCAALAQSTTTKPQPYSAAPWENVLYGAAYYNETRPAARHRARLDKDTALMKQADISVVRMGESTWSLWEPEDGRFEYAWMDRVVDVMGKAGT